MSLVKKIPIFVFCVFKALQCTYLALSQILVCCIKLVIDTFYHLSHSYTPGIYADGYIVFAFPFVRSYVRSFVRSLVRFFVRNSGTFVEFMSKFWLKFL